MKKRPLISVIVPVYNTKLFFLNRCFDSINKQSFKNLELIIIDSSDINEVSKFVDEFNFGFADVIRIKSEKGVSMQRNIGIEKCHGDYVAFIDSDDYINKDYFLELFSSIQSGNYDIAFPLIKKQIFRGDTIIKTWEFKHEDNEFKLSQETFFDFSSRNAFVHPVKLYKRSLIDEFRFDTKLKFGEDLIFNYEISQQRPIVIFASKAIYFYVSEESTNLIKKHLSNSVFNFLDKMILIYKHHKKEKMDCSKVLNFYNEPFLNFYYLSCRRLSIKWIVLSLRYRFFYYFHNQNFKNFLYMFFPIILFGIKKLFKRI